MCVPGHVEKYIMKFVPEPLQKKYRDNVRE